ncbi:MAG: TRAP transporter large permease [Azospirillaceae bacterium]
MIALYGLGLLALLATSLPVAVCILLVGVGAILIADVPHSMIVERLIFGLDSFLLIAIPLFLFMGNLMNASGITARIFAFAQSLVGHWNAGLAQVNVVSSVIFSGMSGSALADAAGLGSIEIKAMREAGYKPAYAAAITAASATIGPVIPPSIAAILYAFIADVSIGRMFLAGIVPGFLMTAVLMATVHWRARHLDLPRTPRVDGRTRLRSFTIALPALVCPVVLIGGMRSGAFTATELAAVGVLYAALLGAIFHRDVSLRDLWSAARETAITAGGIMLIVAAAHVFAWILAREQIPQDLARWIVDLGLAEWQFLLVVNVILLILGMLLDTTAILILVAPVLAPVAVALGLDPVHFGIVMIVNMMVGLLTPPVGMALFVVARLADTSVGAVAREALPYVATLLVTLLVLTYVPGIVLFLPDLVYGGSP